MVVEEEEEVYIISVNVFSRLPFSSFSFIFKGYTDTIINRRPALGDYIDEKLTEQQISSYANDTQLHYRYEGEGSIASDLSSIESIHYQEEHDFRFLYSWGPKFARLADFYAGGVDYDEDLDNA